MRKHLVFALALALSSLLFAVTVSAQTSGLNGAGVGPSATARGIGSTVTDFTLTDVNGAQQSLASLKGEKGTVLIFISSRCPVVKAYNERMEQLAKEYKAKGINFVGINANSNEPLDEVKAHASQHYTFPVLIDKGNKIADRLGAEHTPEVYFLDANNRLVYHGRIDNNRDQSLISKRELTDALDAVLAGKPVTVTETAAVGCTIKRVE
ncbi:MAG TPA: thioredoxin family protein [Pyrinomonadaceae bacterium]|nr:thioredoxin family protein [Pyrinomonadaceae bacterium]